jgi:glutamate/tyrosine decarboxylase-like PLP-dependent enzyme
MATRDALRQSLSEPLPHPDVAMLRQCADQTTAWLLQHFATLPEQGIGRVASRSEMTALLPGPAPEQGRDFSKVLAEFGDTIATHAFRINHPRFLAFVPSAPSFMSVLGDMLCAGTNFFAGVWVEAAGPTAVELVVLDWFRDLLGLPIGTRGLLTSGGSEATLTALHAARETLPRDDRARAVLYCADQRHRSVDRAARILGFRPDQVHLLPGGPDFRLSPDTLAATVRRDRAEGRHPWLLVATAGTTNTGAIDAMPALADLCAAEKLWLHVDAAYGWSAVLVPEGKAALAGIERADSITLDPHKWFAQSFEAGCVLVRDGQKLFDAFSTYAEYTQDVEAAEDELNFADHGIALSRRFRALKIWFSVQVLGLAWHRALVSRCLRLAEYAAIVLQEAGTFEILSPPQLSVVCFRYCGDTKSEDEIEVINQAILDALKRDGRAFISSTRLAGKLALRFCFVNWRTTAQDVEYVVRLLQELGERGVRR